MANNTFLQTLWWLTVSILDSRMIKKKASFQHGKLTKVSIYLFHRVDFHSLTFSLLTGHERSGTSYSNRQFFGTDSKTRLLVHRFCHAEGLSIQNYQLMESRLRRVYPELWALIEIFDNVITPLTQIRAPESLVLFCKGLCSNVSPVASLIRPNAFPAIHQMINGNTLTRSDIEILDEHAPVLLQVYLAVIAKAGKWLVRVFFKCMWIASLRQLTKTSL